MAKIISLFNNKGGVGKTTFLYHLAYRLANRGHKTLMVDCDSQCNLTSYCISEQDIEKAWSDKGNSIYRAIERVARTIGDIRNRAPTKISENLFLIPGDLTLSGFEDRLGDTWNSAKGGDEPALRAQSAIHRVISSAIDKTGAEYVLVDLGPNLGALNRTVISGCDYIIVPVSPDLFSLRGSENLGHKLVTWQAEWKQCINAWQGSGLDLPVGQPSFLGYVTQQHNIRNNESGMTKGWQLFGGKIKSAIRDNIVNVLTPLNQVVLQADGNYDLGMIPNLHSLIPYSQNSLKPVFLCDSNDGLTGRHIYSARDSGTLFDPVADKIESLNTT